MPYTPAGVTVDPNGQTVVVNLTTPSGSAAVAYTTQHGGTLHSFPVTISSRTGFFVVDKETYTLSATVAGVENANGAGGTRSVDLSGGGVLGVQISAANANLAGAFPSKKSGDSETIAAAWNFTTAPTLLGSPFGGGGSVNYGLFPLSSGDPSLASRAAGDGVHLQDGVMTSGQATLTSASAAFVGGDVGKTIRVAGAGPAGADLITTISARNSATSLTLAATASTGVGSTGVDYGTDDTAALQLLYDTAKTQRRKASLVALSSNRFYMITAAINVSRRGQVLGGANTWYCTVKQITASEHAFNILDDTDAGGTINLANQHVIFENMQILGCGQTVATGNGINGGSDGDWFVMRNCNVKQFAKGVFLDGWSQVLFDTSVLSYNGIGCHTAKADSSANTISWINSGCARSTTIGWQHDGGGGCTVTGGDWVEQPLGMQVGTGTGAGAQLTINGGNFEAVTGSGTEFIFAQSGTRLTVTGSQFQKVDGVDADAIRLSGASVIVDNCTLTGMASTKVMVRRTAATDVVKIRPGVTNLSVAPPGAADPGTSYPYAEFIQRADNSIPSAAIGLRGLVLQAMARDSTSADDKLLWFSRIGGGTSTAYRVSRLDGRFEGTGSPEGVVQGRVGDLYVRTDGTAGAVLYVKESGSNTTTGWAAHGGATAGAASRRDLGLAALGLVNENYPLELTSGSSAPVAGTVYGALLGFTTGDVVTKIDVGVVTAGAGTAPTLIRLGLADSSGNIVAVTANVASDAAWTTANTVAQIPLTAPYTIPTAGGYRVVVLQVGSWGTTQMTLARGATIVAGGLMAPLSGGQRRAATYGASQTDLPSVGGALGTNGTTTLSYWFGAS